MAMKDEDYRMREEREMGSRERENTFRERDTSRDRDRAMGSRDWRDDDYRYAQDANRNAPVNYGSASYGQGNYNPGHYNQGSYQGAGSYGHGSYGNTNGGGQGRGQMPRSHYRDGSQTYPNRDWNRDWNGPTDYRSSPYEQDWGRSQWGSSEYGANFRDASVLANERGRYGRNGIDFQASDYGTSYAPAVGRYSGREPPPASGYQPSERTWERYGREGAYDYDSGMYMGRDPGWSRYSSQDGRGEPRHESMMHRVGRFFGIGPKGYKRADSRIEEEVNDALVDDPFIDATNVVVNVKDAEVTLEGTVDDRMAKRRAEDLAANVRGVRDVHNHLKTVPIGHQHDIGTTSANTGLNTEPGKKGSRSNAVS
jgi:hypothetical protein